MQRRRAAISRVFEQEDDGVRHSTYTITVSSNYRPENPVDQANVEDLFYNALADSFDQDLENMLTWNRGFRPDLFLEDPSVAIKMETGGHKQGMRVHAHITLHIVHKTNIQLNYQKMKHVIMKHVLRNELGDKVKGLYLHYTLVKDSREAWEMYQKKKNQIARQSEASRKRTAKDAARQVREASKKAKQEARLGVQNHE